MFRNGLTPETSLNVRAGRILLDKKGNGQQTLYQTTVGSSMYRRVAAYTTGEEQAAERDALLRQCISLFVGVMVVSPRQGQQTFSPPKSSDRSVSPPGPFRSVLGGGAFLKKR